MNKWLKRFSLLLVLILAFSLVKNMFSGNEQKNQDAAIHSYIYDSKTVPATINIPVDNYVSKSPNDDALRYAKLWNIPQIYQKSSEECLKNYLEFHPTNYVKKEGVFEYYGIKIGTNTWQELVAAYEEQAQRVCFSYSGHEAEDRWAQKTRDSFSPSELKDILAFYETELGKKLVDVSNTIGRTIQADLVQRQAKAIKEETIIFENKKERLYKKYIQEHGNWFDKIWFKFFSQ